MPLGIAALSTGSLSALHGRDQELGTVQGFVDRAGQGCGGALAVRAGTGMGKTTFLHEVRRRAEGFRVLGVHGHSAETELPGAALHRAVHEIPEVVPAEHWSKALLRSVADRNARQEDVFAFCASVHRLIVAAAREKPLLILIDDADVLDPLSLRALLFAARRVGSTAVLVLFAETRPTAVATEDLPRLVLGPLDHRASLCVLRDRTPGIPQDLAEDLVDLAGGNPLALGELADSLTAEQLAGLAAPPDSLPPDSRLRRLLRRHFAEISPDARHMVLMAVVDDRLDRDTLLRASEAAGLDLRGWDEALASGLVEARDDLLRVPDELVRSTLYAEASPAQLRGVHQLLVDVLDPEPHRLQRAWHRAAIGAEPRADLADDLADAAVAVSGSGDHSAAFRAFHRSAQLTADPESRARRLLEAGRSSWLAGRSRRSQVLIRQVRSLTGAPELRGMADLLQGGIDMRGGVPSLATQNLLTAAEQLAGANRPLAVTALSLAGEASYLAGDYPRFYRIAQRAGELREQDSPPSVRIMHDHLDGMAATFQGKHEQALPKLHSVVRLWETSQEPFSGILASEAAFTLGDPLVAHDVAMRAVTVAKGAGSSVMEPWALRFRSMTELLLDRHPCAEASSLEGLRVARAIGQQNAAIDHLTILALVAALRGDRETALLRLEAVAEGVSMRGLGRPGALSSWAFAAVELAHDRPSDALDRFRLMTAGAGQANLAIRAMAVPHFVEAAIRCGQRDRAVRALRVFDHWANTTGSVARRALSHRCHALLADRPDDVDEHFGEAIRLHRSCDTAWELAKTELHYGHWLRRGRKPRMAREYLADALKIFDHYGAAHWADKAQAELRAAGETVGRVASGVTEELTPQQAQISKLVAEGATNREVAARLFISPRTVDHHLRNIFAKVGVRSRVELSRMLG
ncbi:helix-turn-helix transcriptional regulator [Parasphingorhabdus pacifica]